MMIRMIQRMLMDKLLPFAAVYFENGLRAPAVTAQLVGYAETGTTTAFASLSCQVCFSLSHSIQK
jgi:hypothetical protein